MAGTAGAFGPHAGRSAWFRRPMAGDHMVAAFLVSWHPAHSALDPPTRSTARTFPTFPGIAGHAVSTLAIGAKNKMRNQQCSHGAGPRVAPPLRLLPTVALACLAAALMWLATPAPAAQRNLQRVDAPNPGPVYIDRSSIQRSGTTVRFLYILDLPIAYSRPSEERQWHSNEVEVILDCAAMTETFVSVREYSAAAAGGYPIGSHSEPASQRKAEKMNPGSTTSILSDYVCKR